MEKLKKTWYSAPSVIRKPIVLILGMAMVIASPFLGWLPGPGGIPLFLLGIALLSTEFKWAERIRDKVLAWLEPVFKWFRANKVFGTILLVMIVAAFVAASYYVYKNYL